MANFDIEFEKLILAEGGYVNDHDDAGGETYLGISRKNNPNWSGWKLIDSIKKGIFDVTRKRSSSASSLSFDSLYSCKYCTYKDLCYCSKEDEVLLESFYKKEEEE